MESLPEDGSAESILSTPSSQPSIQKSQARNRVNGYKNGVHDETPASSQNSSPPPPKSPFEVLVDRPSQPTRLILKDGSVPRVAIPTSRVGGVARLPCPSAGTTRTASANRCGLGGGIPRRGLVAGEVIRTGNTGEKRRAALGGVLTQMAPEDTSTASTSASSSARIGPLDNRQVTGTCGTARKSAGGKLRKAIIKPKVKRPRVPSGPDGTTILLFCGICEAQIGTRLDRALKHTLGLRDDTTNSIYAPCSEWRSGQHNPGDRRDYLLGAYPRNGIVWVRYNRYGEEIDWGVLPWTDEEGNGPDVVLLDADREEAEAVRAAREAPIGG